MKLVKVLIPFNMDDKTYAPNDEIKVTDEQLARIRKISVNMVLVLDEVEEKPKKKTTKK